MRAPAGFSARPVRAGIIWVLDEGDDGWVILAADPQVKIDNKHRDGRPHMHPGRWIADERVELRTDLTVDEAVEAIASQLDQHGYIDIAALMEELR